MDASNKKHILQRVDLLMNAYRTGKLGGEKMPEDENPGLDKASSENYMYFTLPMALNYQRNSYVLWECANKMYKDYPEVFDAKNIVNLDEEMLRDVLVKYKVALQPNEYIIILQTHYWLRKMLWASIIELQKPSSH